MKFRYGLCVCSLFALPLTALSPNHASTQPPQPTGSTMPKVITPPVGPKVNDANFFFTADFIYWKTIRDGYVYAVSGIANVGSDSLSPADPPKRGKSKKPGFDFQPGFKVGAGLKLGHDGWDLYANYTWLNPDTVKSSISDPTGHMLGNADPYFGYTTLSKATSHFKQNFNVVDLELGRNFFLSKFLTLRPYFGLKSAWIDEKLRVGYIVFNDRTNGINGNNEELLSGQITNLNQKLKLDSWGIGIRGGILPVWYFIKDFGLYGNLALSAMWTSFQNHIKTTYSGTISGTSEDTTRSSHGVTPVIELGLGLIYMTTFSNDTYGFSLSGGWEEQVWINFNEAFPPGNMSLQGLTLKMSFEY
jgi:hypothetical protein